MANRSRPLSPHLDVYRWQVQMVTSILHRATGIILAIGALIIAGGLLALMMGADSWACFTDHAGAWYGKAFLFAWTWVFAYHLSNGIRHIVQDFAIGYAKPTFVRSSWISIIASLVLTAIVWAAVCLGA